MTEIDTKVPIVSGGKPQYIKSIRNEMGLSQTEFAKLVGVNRRTLIRWETGELNPSRMAMKAIEATYKVNKGEL